MIKTRFCVISDTHNCVPFPSSDTQHAYRLPLPHADVLLHAGDLTIVGQLREYRVILDALKAADAELKIVIAGNHDLSLDEDYMKLATKGQRRTMGTEMEVRKAKDMWTGEEARTAGIVYLEEGTSTFELKNGAKFTLYEEMPSFDNLGLMLPQIYTSPYTPEFCQWGFAYDRNEDRFNHYEAVSKPEIHNIQAYNPVPSWPAIDIMMTHGPPHGILDKTRGGDMAGCDNLLTALKRCRPRLHCFGHIHEGWGAERRNWDENSVQKLQPSKDVVIQPGGAFVDVSTGGGVPLEFGKETLFVNAAIMDVQYQPDNAPWVIDLDLPAGD
ncbi:hypothetical protein MMC11_002423 [Xylographa trunciseda]|nr:hypothetical protein [Xylographa trunciseda]